MWKVDTPIKFNDRSISQQTLEPQKYLLWFQRISNAKTGKSVPKLTGVNNARFGKPATNRGKPHDMLTRKKISVAKKGKPLTQKQLEALKPHFEKQRGSGNYFAKYPRVGKLNGNYGKKLPEWQKQIIRETRSKLIMPIKDTKPERMMQIALALNGIKFEKHKLFHSSKFFHRVDIFVKPNICIEVDGYYWHTKPEVMKRDIVVNHELQKRGLFVLRFWDKEILNDVQIVTNKIIERIKTISEVGDIIK